jgi:transglutaminase-like putative cysteine protease
MFAKIGNILMNITQQAPKIPIYLKRHILLVLCICYIPHITTQPVWLFILLLVAIAYRLTADYFNYPLMPAWVRFLLVIGCFLLLSGDAFSSGFFIRFLLTYIILKCFELNTIRDIKALVLCNFFLIFSALIVTQELWIIIYLFTALFANLSIMIKLSAPEVKLREIGSNSGWQLLIVIPLSVLLFYVFPRIDPLWRISSVTKVSNSLDDKLTPGSIASFFNDDTMAMRVTFTKNPILRGYWRAITLNVFTGESWYPSKFNPSNFAPLTELKKNEVPDYEVLLEPTQKKWLFYAGYPVAGASNLLFSSDHGLVRGTKEAIIKRFSYSLKVQSEPYHPISSTEFAEATQLPNNNNLQLRAWAKEQYAQLNNDTKAFIAFLHQYIHNQPFWYTLTPPALNADRNQIDRFWFETKKGYCEHYASAVTFILRAAGIPARVVLGYYGGRWNPITNTIIIQQNSAHAWLEYWQQDSGWVRLDPTSFIAPERIDKTINNRQIDLLDQSNYITISDVPWRQKITMLVDSARFYSERWFLFYNHSAQESLLQDIGLGTWSTEELLQVSVISIPIFFALIGLYYQWRQRRVQDPLLREYHLLQQQFRKLNITTHPSATIHQQCQALIERVPELACFIEDFNESYEQLRLSCADGASRKSKNKTLSLFKKLRFRLRSTVVTKHK